MEFEKNTINGLVKLSEGLFQKGGDDWDMIIIVKKTR